MQHGHVRHPMRPSEISLVNQEQCTQLDLRQPRTGELTDGRRTESRCPAQCGSSRRQTSSCTAARRPLCPAQKVDMHECSSVDETLELGHLLQPQARAWNHSLSFGVCVAASTSTNPSPPNLTPVCNSAACDASPAQASSDDRQPGSQLHSVF